MKYKYLKNNIQAHNKIFRVCNLKHSEIYNSFEQNRIDSLISRMIKKRKNLKVLDVGAGTGNLSLEAYNHYKINVTILNTLFLKSQRVLIFEKWLKIK